MTTVAAYIDRNNRHVAIGSDSKWTGRVGFSSPTSKIVQLGDLVVGFAGTGAFTSFEYQAYKGKIKAVHEFAVAYRRHLVDLGHVKVDERSQNLTAGAAIVAHPDGIYLVEVDGGVIEGESYLAIGSGHEVAFGALHVSKSLGRRATEVVRDAVEAAMAHDPWSGGAITLWTTESVVAHPRCLVRVPVE